MIRYIVPVVISLSSWATGSDISAQAVFSAPRAFDTGEGPFIATTGDLNRDGVQDLIVPNREGAAVSILLGDGRGGFSPPAVFPTGRGPRTAVCADLDGDTNLDIITANRDSGDLTFLFGDGRGGFPRSAELPVSRGPQAVAVMDLNGDGAPDLAIAGREARRILIYLNDGKGRFSGPDRLIVGKGPRSIIAADLNGDGKADLATADRIDGTVSVRFGNGYGGFPDSLTLIAGRAPTMLVAEDINRDGSLDLIVSDRTISDMVFGEGAPGMDEPGKVYIFLGDGKGRFAEPSAWETGGHPAGIAVADLNNDTALDIAVANNAPDNLVVLFGSKDGTYSAPIVISAEVGDTPRAVLTVDLDRDGRPDLIVSSRDSNRVYVLMNETSG